MTTIIDERRELWKKLAPIMGEDSDLAAGILIMALRREFGYPIKEEDQPRFQAALDRLPRGSTRQAASVACGAATAGMPVSTGP